mmetsp:Transcript_11505/g.26668  ORF Transcript_11505/g.26668 Transcript_11505/m.26668 type:complete len:788 (-) Transcript_11505:129-2492(-)
MAMAAHAAAAGAAVESFTEDVGNPQLRQGPTWTHFFTGETKADYPQVAEVPSSLPPGSSVSHFATQGATVASSNYDSQHTAKRLSLKESIQQLASSEQPKLTGPRRRVHQILDSRFTRLLVAFVIIVNAWQVCYETDQAQVCQFGEGQQKEDACNRIDGWLFSLNWAYLAFYTVELILRIYVDRLRFFFNKWDAFDFMIVTTGILSQVARFSEDLQRFVGIFRLARVARLAKAFRQVKLPRELHIMVHGLIGAVKATVMGAGLLAVMLVGWSLAAVEILNEMNHQDDLLDFYTETGCERCPRAWESVWQGCLSFLQMTLMGDSWGKYALPLIEKQPFTLILFAGASFSISLLLANLILAVILEKALKQQVEDAAAHARERERATRRARQGFVELCRVMDADQSGFLSLAEYLDGYESVRGFRDQLTIMGIQSHDIETLFHMMDKDRTGHVSYEDFADQLVTMKNQDLHAMSLFMKHQIMEMSFELADLKSCLVPREEILRMAHKRQGSRSSTTLTVSSAPAGMTSPPRESANGAASAEQQKAAFSGVVSERLSPDRPNQLAQSQPLAAQTAGVAAISPRTAAGMQPQSMNSVGQSSQPMLRRAATGNTTGRVTARELHRELSPVYSMRGENSNMSFSNSQALVDAVSELRRITEDLRQQSLKEYVPFERAGYSGRLQADGPTVSKPCNGITKEVDLSDSAKDGFTEPVSPLEMAPSDTNGHFYEVGGFKEGRPLVNDGQADTLPLTSRELCRRSRNGHSHGHPPPVWCRGLQCQCIPREEHEFPITM